MNKPEISRRIIKKILKFKTHPYPVSDAKNKLEILAVKSGLKPAFQEFKHLRSKDNPNILLLKQLATILGLKHKSTVNPPLYFSRNPKVKKSFLDAYYIRADFEALWIYNNPKVETSIVKCLSSELNEGYILGYPDCCIRWHEEARVREVESSFRDIEHYMKMYPLKVARLEMKSEVEMYKDIINMLPHVPENKAKWEKMTDEHVLGTWMKYPFVPHWACSACLKSKSEKTKELNRRYKELALSLGQQFIKDFLSKIEQVVRDYRTSHPSI